MDWGAERERLVLWLPVAFAAGIALYFALPEEPSRWVGPWALLAVAGTGWALRRFALTLLVAPALLFAVAGFTLAVERTHRVAHPVLARATAILPIEGRIADIEPTETGTRIVLDRLRVGGGTALRDGGGERVPERVRVRLAGPAGDLRLGQRLALRAGLSPPAPPVAPGAYDFSRAAWFQDLGAVGFAVGPPRVETGPDDADGLDGRLTRVVLGARLALAERIGAAIARAGLPVGAQAVAAALVTAVKGPIPEAVLEDYRNAGLAHVLVISGLHMSIVAGLVFVGVRALLALIPYLALNFPIKKWTAAAALAVTAGYLVVSGAPVPTQRAFLMSGVVLVAVLLDRDALSLRSLGWAAIAVLALHPEALIGPSFQMSFAAVYALIGAYEVMGPRLAAWRRQHGGWWRSPALYVFGVLLTTQVAGTATAFYTVYHFNRYATYSLLGNLLAMPVVGFWVMPAVLLGFALMPFGLDRWGWAALGYGVETVNRIAAGVGRLPGAELDLPAVPPSALILFTLGGLWLILWRRRWRLFGLAGMAAGLLLWAADRPPDLLIDSSGRLAAVRAEDGRLAFSGRVAARRARTAWARRAGQGDDGPKWAEGENGACDALGCVATVAGRRIAFAQSGEALGDDCRLADLVVTRFPYFGPCPSARTLIDGYALRTQGAHAVWLEKDGDRVVTVADAQGRRPWSPFRARPGRARPALPGTENGADPVNNGASAPPDGPEP